MTYTISEISKIIKGVIAPQEHDLVITELCIDSRKIHAPATSIFFALSSDRRDGHDFIPDAYSTGVRAFVVRKPINASLYPEAIFIQVPDVLIALQDLAAHHRSRFSIPVIGITGSNGKTVVKEWLYQLLCPDFAIVRSPRSFNSQIGVPLSVWRMNETHTLALFEAGISRPEEMERLAKIIRPTMGVLTHLGAAHDEGFTSRHQKEQEKRKLFVGAAMPEKIQLDARRVQHGKTTLIANNGDSIVIPFTDEASLENALTCWSVMRHLSYDIDTIAARMLELQPIQMRLEIKKGIQQCVLLNDAYSFDLDSLVIALDYLEQQAGKLAKTAILTDLPEATERDYDDLIAILIRKRVTRLITMGPNLQKYLHRKKIDIPGSLKWEAYSDRTAFEKHFSPVQFHREAILLKGARHFGLEGLLSLLEAQLHQTRLEIDLGVLRKNIRAYQSILSPGVSIMAMVKSFSYGSGGVELARVMQEEGVSYLGVAYADEGVALREGGIRLPIMVMNTEPAAFDSMLEHRLEPVLYSLEMTKAFQEFLRSQGEMDFPVHLELETGMHRLGIAFTEFDQLTDLLRHGNSFRIRTVFSHLAAGEDPSSDAFSASQYEELKKAVGLIRAMIPYAFKVHLANSAAAIRKPDWQLDMVRIGIGLYGIDPAASNRISLGAVTRLLATVAQVQDLKPGDSVSYNRRVVVDRPTRIATIRLGYADGFPRRLGNGVGYVILNGQKAPVMGTVCMDMFMVDISSIPNVKTGDDATVFGPELPLTELAQLAGTIPYEIMTGISQRVKRIYVEES